MVLCIMVINMFFELENYVKEIFNVSHIVWSEQKCTVLPRDYSALAFRIKGSGCIYYDDKIIEVHPNELLYLPQNMGYSAEYSDTELIVIHFVTANKDTDVEVFSLDNTEKLYKLFLEALNKWTAKDIGYKISIMSMLYEILSIIYKETQKKSLPKNFIDAVSFINSNYLNNSLSVKNVCLEANISETYFRELFSKHYKKTPVSYINELKIEYARNLIASGTSIEDAAYQGGFNDPKYFARVVKKHFGCTPRDLKNYGK